MSAYYSNFSNKPTSNVGVCDAVKRPTSLFSYTDTDSRIVYAKTLCDEFSGRYSTYQDRMVTFYNWPKCLAGPKPDDLALAGFYYTGAGDIVRCFSCNILFKEWEPSNSATQEHLRWSPMCKFIKFVTDKKQQARCGVENF